MGRGEGQGCIRTAGGPRRSPPPNQYRMLPWEGLPPPLLQGCIGREAAGGRVAGPLSSWSPPKVDGGKGAETKFSWFSLFFGVQCPVSPKPWNGRGGGGYEGGGEAD